MLCESLRDAGRSASEKRRKLLRVAATSCGARDSISFSEFASFVYGEQKFAALVDRLREATGKSTRSCEYYLGGSVEPPMSVLLAMFGDLVARMRR